MQEKNINRWLLPDALSPDQLIEKISRKYTIQTESSRNRTVTYFDSFDWRLYRKSFLLTRSDERWALRRRDSGRAVASIFEKDQGLRKFAWEFPSGRLANQLKKILGVRGLLALVTFDVYSRRLQVMNSDRKTIAHIDMIAQKIQTEPRVFYTMRLCGIRGYENITRKLARNFRRWGIGEVVSAEYLFKKGVAAMGRAPLDYHSKFSIVLAPDLSIRQAARAIFRQLLDTMRQNEAGIFEDIDSEFLHDFRVAIRRTRSGLTQLKDVLPPEITETFKREFAALGQVTGPTRDLDVYLLYEKDYLSRLPGTLRAGLTVFFSEMADRRHQEWEKMVSTLKSSRYRTIIENWQAYLDGSDPGGVSRHSEQPVGGYARKIIYRRYRRILKKGGAIGSSSPDETLHRLRIQSKKLRYSLEFFASLFPKKEMNRVIKQLKGLQTNLGGFNDLSVQQEMLQNYLADIRPGSRKNQDLAVAIGGLLTALYHEQKEVRRAFVTTFETFSGSKNEKLFSNLFG